MISLKANIFLCFELWAL